VAIGVFHFFMIRGLYNIAHASTISDLLANASGIFVAVQAIKFTVELAKCSVLVHDYTLYRLFGLRHTLPTYLASKGALSIAIDITLNVPSKYRRSAMLHSPSFDDIREPDLLSRLPTHQIIAIIATTWSLHAIVPSYLCYNYIGHP
jgi:hypothetical protein